MKINPTFVYEESLWQQGYFLIAGIDEAGRGAWAGPVMAGAVIFPSDPDLGIKLNGIRESKLMTPAEREAAVKMIDSNAICWAVGSADNQEIDRLGILPATRLAMSRAVSKLTVFPDHLLIDYVRLPNQLIPQKSIPKGDMNSFSIAAASIMAKVTRDHWMAEVCAKEFPGYGFECHKGYGTAFHRARLDELGPCKFHRMTFHPIARDLKLF